MNNINVAIIGTGFMSWVHAEALKRVGVNVLGICGSSAEKSKQAATKLSIPKAYSNYEEVLADTEIHSVHIGTPNRVHFRMAKQALTAGKHVLCEKPLSMTSDESAELVELSKSYPNLAAGVNYNMRYYPLALEAKQRAQEGSLGKLVHINGSYTQDWLTYDTDYNWRVIAEENGELRAIADIGTHWLDLIHSISGLEVESLCADLMIAHATRHKPLGEVTTYSGKTSSETEAIDITTEDYGAVLLKFKGGTRGTLHVSQVAPGRKNCLKFEIAGSQQSLAWNSEEPNNLWIGHRNQPNESLIKDPALLSSPAQNAAAYPGGHNEGYPDSFKQCFHSFYSYISQGDFSKVPTFPTFADGHREIVLCEAILKSHQQQKWITIED